MSNKKLKHYNVLIQVESQNEAERIISVFRTAGIATRAHRVTSNEDFIESIEHSRWHLFVADNHHPDVTLSSSLDEFKKHKLCIPSILLTSDASAETRNNAFKAGISDVINKTDDTHFAFAAKREMDNAIIRAHAKTVEHELAELKAHTEHLLDNSEDAIAFVADGIIMRCNEAFANTFAYTAEQLDCASMIDLVSDADQNKFKNFFKMFAKGDLETAELAFKGLNHEKQELDVFMTLSSSTLDDEPCTRISIANNSQAGNNSSGIIDTATELFNRYYLSEQITATALQVNNGGVSASLLLFSLDNYSNLASDIYLSGIDAIIKDLAEQLKKSLPSDAVICRLGDDSIGVTLQQKPDAALKKATELLSAIENHIFEYNGRTMQYTCICSVLHLNNKNAAELLDHGIEAIHGLRLSKGKNAAAIFTPSAKEVAALSSNDIDNIDEAIEHGLVKLLYQPLMSLQGRIKENYEVTVWLNDKGQNVYPTEMIKNAKNSKLDRWIILESTKALALHRAAGHPTRMIINLTANGLLDDGLATWLKVATKAANLTHDLIIFQFDEEDIRNNLKAAIKTINALHDNKFLVACRHFGKDAEPFKLLNHLKLDLIRFDASFTASVLKGDSASLKELIRKAKEAQIETVIPDVDNASALATLWQLGTHYVQGSYVQLPTPVMNHEFTELG